MRSEIGRLGKSIKPFSQVRLDSWESITWKLGFTLVIRIQPCRRGIPCAPGALGFNRAGEPFGGFGFFHPGRAGELASKIKGVKPGATTVGEN